MNPNYNKGDYNNKYNHFQVNYLNSKIKTNPKTNKLKRY